MDIAIDLGTSSILVYIKGRGVVLQEPSIVAIKKDTKQILAVGLEARRMLGRTPEDIESIRPLKHGAISNYEITEQLLKHFIKKAQNRAAMRKPRISICVPPSATSVQRRAAEDAAKAAGAREVYVIEETIAAAVGAGIDIFKPVGSFVLDIGAGTADASVISLGGSVVSGSVEVGGDDLDQAIIRHVRKKYNVLIGERTSESLKITIGTAVRLVEDVYTDVKGQNLLTGLPVSINITSEDIREALADNLQSIIAMIRSVLERTPPELASDIAKRGVVMTGGTSTLHGLDILISQETGLKTILATDPINCVALGTGMYMEQLAAQQKLQ
ncbi:MAG: rod shape-determining protein [Defluviitaleaceae bacterium]|nr:rod shape-determining protein [Defluviitaleaceae bacterium]